MEQLSVYLFNDPAGTLSCDAQKRFSFQYAPEWIQNSGAPPLSLSLPFREDPYPDEKSRPFFTNLLPESAVREAVARKLGISSRNDFALLEALGGECAGAVTLLPPGKVPEGRYNYQVLSHQALHELLVSLPQRPFLAGEDGIRLSLAGAQEKLPVYMEKDRVFLPREGSPSSHIIKPGIAGIDGSVRNEAFCMALAEKMGLAVPKVDVKKTPAEVFVVERYDRHRDAEGDLRRVHQEDFCQAMGLMAEAKYAAEGGPTLEDCFSLLTGFSTHPALDRKALLEWIVFNYLICNTDGHAKNLSLLLKPDEIRLAPFYDLMCTGVYEGINDKLAMKIGGENRPQWIQPRHWQRLAKAAGIGKKFVEQTVFSMADKIGNAANDLASVQQSNWGPSPIVDRILAIIARQVNCVNIKPAIK